MKYVGSKNKLSKELTPIIQSYINENTNGYLEPFVGGANMIDKIKHKNKIGCDIHKQLIELLKYAQDLSNVFPKTISEQEYQNVKNNKSNVIALVFLDPWYSDAMRPHRGDSTRDAPHLSCLKSDSEYKASTSLSYLRMNKVDEYKAFPSLSCLRVNEVNEYKVSINQT